MSLRPDARPVGLEIAICLAPLTRCVSVRKELHPAAGYHLNSTYTSSDRMNDLGAAHGIPGLQVEIPSIRG